MPGIQPAQCGRVSQLSITSRLSLSRYINLFQGVTTMGWWASEPLCQGDEGADIIDEALAKLNEVWAENWGRRIKLEELLALINFCWGEEPGEEQAFFGHCGLIPARMKRLRQAMESLAIRMSDLWKAREVEGWS
jgi:hypothetical protein